MTAEKFISVLGSRFDYFIKGNTYKTVSNGTYLQWQLYVPADNKIYNKMANSDIDLWIDAATNPDSVISYTLNKKTLQILGYNCDELILTCTSGIQKYYYDTNLSINPAIYININLVTGGNMYQSQILYLLR